MKPSELIDEFKTFSRLPLVVRLKIVALLVVVAIGSVLWSAVTAFSAEKAKLAATPSALPAAVASPTSTPPSMAVKTTDTSPEIPRPERSSSPSSATGIYQHANPSLVTQPTTVERASIEPTVANTPAASAETTSTTQPILRTFPIPDAQVDTRRGLLKVTSLEDGKTMLTLAGRKLKQEFGEMSLELYFRDAEREVVLYGVYMDGAGELISTLGGIGLDGVHIPKPKSLLTFLVLEEGTEPSFIQGPPESTDLDGNALFSSFNTPKVLNFEPGVIALDLGFDNGKSKRAELKGDALRVYWEDAPKSFIGAEKCDTLYDAIRACAEFERCDDIELPGYLLFSAFSTDALFRHCRRICDGKGRATRAVFEREVCGK